jgi:hypothetical protein
VVKAINKRCSKDLQAAADGYANSGFILLQLHHFTTSIALFLED